MSCDPNDVERIKQIAGKHGISLQVIGETISDWLEIKLDGRVVVSAAISELGEIYENALADALKERSRAGESGLRADGSR